MPMPSTTRLPISQAKLVDKAPSAAPPAIKPRAIMIVVFDPRRCKAIPAGSASASPMAAMIDISSPAWVRSMWKVSIINGMMGGILNWLKGETTLARYTTTRITQA